MDVKCTIVWGLVTCLPMCLVPRYTGCLPTQCVLWSEALGTFENPKKGVLEPSGVHVTCFQSDMECDVCIHKCLYVSVVLPSGTNVNMFHEVWRA